MGIAIKKGRRYTCKDYLTWPHAERWEIREGAVYNMSTALKMKHQNIASGFHIKLKKLIQLTGATQVLPPLILCLTNSTWSSRMSLWAAAGTKLPGTTPKAYPI